LAQDFGLCLKSPDLVTAFVSQCLASIYNAMGQCPSRKNNISAESVFAKEVTENVAQPTQQVPTKVTTKKFRADAQPFVPREEDDSYFGDDEDKATLMPWEKFLEDKKKEAWRPSGKFSRDNGGKFTSSYRDLLNNKTDSRPWQKTDRKMPWSKKDETFDPVQSWRSMQNEKREPVAPAAKKKKQTPLKKAILKHKGEEIENAFTKFQKIQDKVNKTVGNAASIAEQVEKMEAAAPKDDSAIKSDLVPYGLSDRHYFSAEEDSAKTNRHIEESQVVKREYVTMELTESLESSVTALLYKLRHLKVAELSAGIESRRYAVGLREVGRLVRGDEASALIVAPDVERNSGGMIEQKLAGLVETCNNNNIPVVYALSRRQLGQAVMKNVAISVMLVQSTRGAETEFASVLEETKEAQKIWGQTKRAPPGL